MEYIDKVIGLYMHIAYPENAIEQIHTWRKILFIILSLVTFFSIARIVTSGIRRLHNDLIKSKKCQKWPKTTGTIVVSAIDYIGCNEDTTLFNRVEYEFNVGNTQYSSDRYSFLKSMGGNGLAKSCEAFQKKFHVGLTPDVFYNPDNPSEAVLSTETGFFLVLERFTNFLINNLLLVCLVLVLTYVAACILLLAKPMTAFFCLLVIPGVFFTGLYFLKKMILSDEKK